MCTLTYLPSAVGFAMVSSRDEMRGRGKMARPTHDPALKALYPVDERSGGTWVLTSSAGFSLNLLNGGRERHAPGRSYRHSRGLIPLQFAQAGGIAPFLASFDPDGLEPFTLVVIGHAVRSVTSLIWNGKDLERIDHDPLAPHIWSSSTLYDAAMKAEREAWFQDALAGGEHLPALDRLIDFHLHGGHGKAPVSHTIRMARPHGPETVCITGIGYSASAWTVRYHDLVANARMNVSMIG